MQFFLYITIVNKCVYVSYEIAVDSLLTNNV